MLYLIGLGLDVKGISVQGLEAARECDTLMLESYTSILRSFEQMKTLIQDMVGREVTCAYRETVEDAEEILAKAEGDGKIGLLIVGDPFCATTHADLYLRAVKKGIPVRVFHGASIISAIGCVGLEVYKYGHAVSIVFFTEDWRPDSFYDRIQQNKKSGLHTLCLLDIKTHEKSVENIILERDIYEPPRFMSAALAAKELLEIEEKKGLGVAASDCLAVAACRIGTDTQKIVCCTLAKMAELEEFGTELGPPLHSLVLPGPALHPIEAEMLELWALDEETKEIIHRAAEMSDKR